MRRILRAFLLAPILAMSLCLATSEPADANDYWNRYWGWYNNTYRPYYRHQYRRGPYNYGRPPYTNYDRYRRHYDCGYRFNNDYWRGYYDRHDGHALRGRHNSLEIGPLHFDWR